MRRLLHSKLLLRRRNYLAFSLFCCLRHDALPAGLFEGRDSDDEGRGRDLDRQRADSAQQSALQWSCTMLVSERVSSRSVELKRMLRSRWHSSTSNISAEIPLAVILSRLAAFLHGFLKQHTIMSADIAR